MITLASLSETSLLPAITRRQAVVEENDARRGGGGGGGEGEFEVTLLSCLNRKKEKGIANWLRRRTRNEKEKEEKTFQHHHHHMSFSVERKEGNPRCVWGGQNRRWGSGTEAWRCVTKDPPSTSTMERQCPRWALITRKPS